MEQFLVTERDYKKNLMLTKLLDLMMWMLNDIEDERLHREWNKVFGGGEPPECRLRQYRFKPGRRPKV